MKKAAIALVLLAVVLGGCIAVDAMTQFRVTGEVFDELTDAPLEGVTVVFIDTSPGPDGVPLDMGESDDAGHIDVTLDYGWGGLVTLPEFLLGIGRAAPPTNIDIELSKDGYVTETLPLEVTREDVQEDSVDLAIGEVYLTPDS